MTKASNGKSANRSSTVQPHGTKTSTKDVRNGESSRQIMELIKTVSDKADKKRQESQDDVASKKWRCGMYTGTFIKLCRCSSYTISFKIS
jgi:hypothetical protein